MKKFVLALLLLWIALPIRASYSRNYQMEDGLSHNSVWTIMQDSEGFVWVGTKSGLNRFDGQTFKVYRKENGQANSIGHNFIHAIREDSRHRLFVGTRGGLYVYNRRMDNFESIPISPNRDKEVNVNDIREDALGNIWVACHGDGIFKLSPDLELLESYKSTSRPNSLPSNYVWTICPINPYEAWIGLAGNGLVHFNMQTKVFTPIKEPQILNKQNIFSIHADKNNNIWVGTSNAGLFLIDAVTRETSRFMPQTENIKSIRTFSSNELIMGTENGVLIFNTDTHTHYSISEENSEGQTDRSVFAIAPDHEGSFWIGTYFNGVNYFSPASNRFLSYGKLFIEGKDKIIVSGMVEDDQGNILLATHNDNHIYRFDPRTHRQEKAFTVRHNNIQYMLRNGDKLYVSLYGRGVDVLSLHTGETIGKLNLHTLEGKSIFKLHDGTLAFALEEGGCILLAPDGKTKRLHRLNSILIADVVETPDGCVWFATYSNGLFAWKDNTWENYNIRQLASSPNRNDCTPSCLLYEDGYLWMGTTEQGILLFDPNQRSPVRSINETHGMPSPCIYAMQQDDLGNIWTSTANGFAKIFHNSHKVKSFGYIGKNKSYPYRCTLRSADEHLYFGDTNGFISLTPNRLTTNEYIPHVVVTRFLLDDMEITPQQSPLLKQSIQHTHEITLPHDQATFTLNFAALSFIFAEANQYEYILEGFDKAWNHTSTPTAQYKNIPPGTYTFKVKGANNDGVWNDHATAIRIHIEPPVWLSPYLLLTYVLLAIGMIGLIFRRYTNRINRINEERQYRFQAAKEKETYEAKINFFTNIAHEIRTPLSLIIAPLEAIIQSGDGNQQTRSNLSTIEKNANRLHELINQLLDLRKIESEMFTLHPKTRDAVAILKNIVNQYNTEARRKGISMQLVTESDNLYNYMDGEALHKIISNLISNALKFTTNRIEVELKSQDGQMCILVTDNGPGISPSSIEMIFQPFYQTDITQSLSIKGSGLGLPLARNLSQKMGGSLCAYSDEGKGATFVCRIPIRLEHADEETATTQLAQPQPTEQPDEQPEDTRSGHTAVLLVEDNEELRTFIHNSLATHFQIYEAENGQKALEILDKQDIDVIVSDILMPVMDGMELCSRIKNDMAYSHLPMILLSAKTDIGSKVSGLQKGAEVYMEKPFSIEQLRAQIDSLIRSRNNLQKMLAEKPLQCQAKNKGDGEHMVFIEKLNTYILNNMASDTFSIDSLAYEFALSRTIFQKKIKNITGMTANEYIKLIRLNKSAELLAEGKYRINEICTLVGFNSPSYYSKCFYEHFGKLPKDYAEK